MLFRSFAPFSIVPTILAIGISLWWSSLDATLRRLQPYLAMSKEPLKPKDGVCLSYQSSYWAWAMVKALKHRHWMLVAITLGTTLSQICKSTVLQLEILHHRSYLGYYADSNILKSCCVYVSSLRKEDHKRHYICSSRT